MSMLELVSDKHTIEDYGISLRDNANLIDRTDVSSFGLGRRPDKRTIISNDQISKLFINMKWRNPHSSNTEESCMKREVKMSE